MHSSFNVLNCVAKKDPLWFPTGCATSLQWNTTSGLSGILWNSADLMKRNKPKHVNPFTFFPTRWKVKSWVWSKTSVCRIAFKQVSNKFYFEYTFFCALGFIAARTAWQALNKGAGKLLLILGNAYPWHELPVPVHVLRSVDCRRPSDDKEFFHVQETSRLVWSSLSWWNNLPLASQTFNMLPLSWRMKVNTFWWRHLLDIGEIV